MPIKDIIQPEIINIDRKYRLRKFDGIFNFAYEWYQDTELVFLVDGVKESYTYEKLSRMYNYLDSIGELYFIEVLDNGYYIPIGDVTFFKEDMPIVIGKEEYRNKGIGLKVISALIERAKQLKYKTIYVNEIYHYNIASRKCFEKAGFKVIKDNKKGVKLGLKIKYERK